MDTFPKLRVRFPEDDGFLVALRQRANAYFEGAGRARTGGAAMRAKTAALFAWFTASYLLLLLRGETAPWAAVLLTLSLALATAGIGFSVMHDANHGAYSRSVRVNRALGWVLDLLGGSSYVWRFKHNVGHHTYANVAGLDPDIDAGPFLRLAPSQPLRRWHRFQHLYGWGLYGALALKWWFLDDFVDLARGRVGAIRLPRPRGGELAALIAGKVVFFGWALVLPILVFRSAWVAPFFLLGAFTVGVVLSAVFQLAHAVPEAEFHVGGERLACGWAEHQVRATVDFAPSNRLLRWYLGGLNYQVEHHLFPDVCHQHHPALARIVDATCAEYRIPLHRTPTLGAALAAHHHFLRAMGRAGTRPAAAPSLVSAIRSESRT